MTRPEARDQLRPRMPTRPKRSVKRRLLCALGRQFFLDCFDTPTTASSRSIYDAYAELKWQAERLKGRVLDEDGEPDKDFVMAAEHYVKARCDADDWNRRLAEDLNVLRSRNAEKLFRQLVQDGASPDEMADILRPHLAEEHSRKSATRASRHLLGQAKRLSQQFLALAEQYQNLEKLLKDQGHRRLGDPNTLHTLHKGSQPFEETG